MFLKKENYRKIKLFENSEQLKKDFINISKNRKLEIENAKIAATYKQKINGFNNKKELELFLAEEPQVEYSTNLNLSTSQP